MPCGLHGVQMTSIARLLGTAPPLPELAARLVACFADVFERRPVEVAAERLDPIAV